MPCLDFDLIRREIGLSVEARTPILEAMAQMEAAARERAQAILDRHEEMAAINSRLQEQAAEVLRAIRAAGVPVGLLTRNSRRCVNIVLESHGLEVDRIVTREDGPPKPSPEPVYALCRAFGVAPAQAWMVGDYLFDIQCGRAAGTRTVLMIGDAKVPEYAHLADHVVRRLRELLPLMGLDG